MKRTITFLKAATLGTLAAAALSPWPALATEPAQHPNRLIIPNSQAMRRALAANRPALGQRLVTIAYPGATTIQAIGINNRDEVVGQWTDRRFFPHGFLYAGGKFTSIDYPDSAGTIVSGISVNGTIVGSFQDQSGNVHGFLLNQGNYTVLDFPGAYFTQAYGINEAGNAVVGYYQIFGESTMGFLWRNGTFTTLTFSGGGPDSDTLPQAVNDRGEVAGNWSERTNHAFLLSKGIYTVLDRPSDLASIATGINSEGQIVFADQTESTMGAFVLSHGEYTPIEIPGAAFVLAGGINDKGDIVGGYALPGTSPVGFLLLGRAAPDGSK